MRVIVLTTGSLRRRYLVRALQATVPISRVFVETGEQAVDEDNFHPLEVQSKEYEKQTWFNGRPASFTEITDALTFPRLDGPEALRAIAATKPHMMIVFGTRKLSQSLIDICPLGAFNIHTGDPERYRGLDAHLWAIYHRDFNAVSVTIHRLTAELDGGEILATQPVPISPKMALFQLRRASTEVAVDLVRQAVVAFRARGNWLTRPQRHMGDYYSSMSATAKEICVQRFARHTARL